MFGFHKRSAPAGWVGCAPHGEHTALALVQPVPGAKPVLHWAAQEPWTHPPQTLGRLRRRLKLDRHRRVAVLQRHQYHCVAMDAPADLPREDWASATRWQLREAVEFPIDNAAVDVLAVPPGASYRANPQLIAVASPEADIRPLIEWGSASRLPWQAVDITETALRNLSLRIDHGERAQALLHCHAQHATLVVTWKGELLWTRQMELALLARASGPDDERLAAFEQTALELQRSLDGIERSFGQVSLVRLLITPMPGLDALIEHLRPLLYVPVEALDLRQVVDWQAGPDLIEDPALLNAVVVAVGAALRED